MKSLVRRIVGVFSSFWLACLLLFGLFVLTFFGTIEQGTIGLYAAQNKYFSSLIVWLDLDGLPPLPIFPGGYLLMSLLSLNLLLGGILRLRRSPSGIGLFVVHLGMLFMLLGGLITHHFALEGQMALEPGQTSSRFQSSHQWELAVIDMNHPGHEVEYILPESAIDRLGRAGRVFSDPGLPFELAVSEYRMNSMPQAVGPMVRAAGPVVDQFTLRSMPADREFHRNLAGVVVRVIAPGEPEQSVILWGGSPHPWSIEVDGRRWNIDLRRRQWVVPFSLTLERFIHEFHPGTQIARTYESDVIKTEDGERQAINIRMNEPLRHRGYTFFQSSYYQIPGSEDFGSVLAVVRNPADQFPLWACIIVTAGLLLHFGIKLSRHLRRERERRVQ